MKLWIARDKDGLIYLYMKKPYLITHYFDSKHLIGEIDKDLFPEITFDNSPQEVKITLPTTGLDRGRKDSIIRALKKLEKDYMLNYAEEIDWINKLLN